MVLFFFRASNLFYGNRSHANTCSIKVHAYQNVFILLSFRSNIQTKSHWKIYALKLWTKWSKQLFLNSILMPKRLSTSIHVDCSLLVDQWWVSPYFSNMITWIEIWHVFVCRKILSSGWCWFDRTKDHRRHIWWLGCSWWWCLLR